MESPHPQQGQVVCVRQRHYYVNGVEADRGRGRTLVKLSCIADDAAGDDLEVLWEVEVGAKIVPEATGGLEHAHGLDEPAMFGAYLNALRWECVTSTDRRLLQAPFRAGIDLKPYQLEPLRKALELPRVNLFIADDVGLGKTIEAGLIMQELLLRQRIDRILVICPPSVKLQWQEELDQRFGLNFELYDRDFVTDRRRERGWGINPWTTHPRFIVSAALLRGQRPGKRTGQPRANHLELLLSALGRRAERSLLILDEAHHAAPASGGLYAIDSRTTRAIRQVASRFEHRMFLSATPHNGHSNSFSALLELLDPQRFTRGVKVKSVKQLAPVMVRRLKRDLRREVGGLPERKLVDHVIPLSPDAPEVRLGKLLADYEPAYRESLAGLSDKQQAARSLVCIHLHQRLLSSVYAFSRTLEVHARAAERRLEEAAAAEQLPLPLAPPKRGGDDDDDVPEEELDQREDEWVDAVTATPTARALELLREMRSLAAEHRNQPDGRVEELARWIRENLCPGGTWNRRRVVVFTEFDDTLQWLLRSVPPLLDGADTNGRIGRYHGGMGEASREALKGAFNTDPATHPLRILLATDAAREGINLQAHCYDLFHFDLPWNPARIEQRNGRIDRTLQPEPLVYCRYFDLPGRPEDRVLTYLVEKTKTIHEELGSLASVVSGRIAARLEQGLRDCTPEELEELADPTAREKVSVDELADRTADAEVLRGDLAKLENQLERSRRRMGYSAEHLREAVDLGLRLATRDAGLAPVAPATSPPSWTLPDLEKADRTWEGTLTPLRATADPEDPVWRRPPVRPVAFRAAHRLDADTVQLHLGHPLVKRLVTRFRARGFASDDLHRVTVIANPDDSVRRVLAFGRLALFGHGATRLHEELIVAAARWSEDAENLDPYKAGATRTATEVLFRLLERGPSLHPSTAHRDTARRHAATDFGRLLPALQAEAEDAEAKARTALAARGDQEAQEMERLLERQEADIRDTLRDKRQLELALTQADRSEREQFERDQRHMLKRLDELEQERVREPATIRRAYEVVLRRFEPVGVVYLWPED